MHKKFVLMIIKTIFATEKTSKAYREIKMKNAKNNS